MSQKGHVPKVPVPKVHGIKIKVHKITKCKKSEQQKNLLATREKEEKKKKEKPVRTREEREKGKKSRGQSEILVASKICFFIRANSYFITP